MVTAKQSTPEEPESVRYIRFGFKSRDIPRTWRDVR